MSLKEAVKDIVKDEIDGYTKQEAEYWFDNPSEYCCANGCIGALIYYTDTEKFANEHHEEIIELMNEYGAKPMSLNDMAWFGFEAVVPELKDEVLEEMFLTDDEVEELQEELYETIKEKTDGKDGDIDNQVVDILESMIKEIKDGSWK